MIGNKRFRDHSSAGLYRTPVGFEEEEYRPRKRHARYTPSTSPSPLQDPILCPAAIYPGTPFIPSFQPPTSAIRSSITPPPDYTMIPYAEYRSPNDMYDTSSSPPSVTSFRSAGRTLHSTPKNGRVLRMSSTDRRGRGSLYERPEAYQFRGWEDGAGFDGEEIVLGVTPYPSSRPPLQPVKTVPARTPSIGLLSQITDMHIEEQIPPIISTLNRSISSNTDTTMSIRTPPAGLTREISEVMGLEGMVFSNRSRDTPLSPPGAPRRKRPDTPFQIHSWSTPPSPTTFNASNFFSDDIIYGSPDVGRLAFSTMSSDSEEGDAGPPDPPSSPSPSARRIITRTVKLSEGEDDGEGDDGEAGLVLDDDDEMVSCSSGPSSTTQLLTQRRTLIAERRGNTRHLGRVRIGKAAVGVEKLKFGGSRRGDRMKTA